MRALLALLAAVVICSITPAVLIASYFFVIALATESEILLFSELGPLFLTISLVAGAHAIALGLPIYFLVRHFWKINYIISALAGFVVGFIPLAIYSWPLRNLDSKSSSMVNGEWLKIDGEVTYQGWVSYFQGNFTFAGLGLLAAVSFWYALSKLNHPNKRMQSDAATPRR